ncbi:MAG: hypothetical protein ABI566_07730 [Pseudolysinimonas sp.]
MTDTPPTPPTPSTPATPPAAAPAGAYAPAAEGPKQTQSLVGFLLGVGSIVFSGLGLIGVGLGIAAIIVTNKAKKSEPGAPAWMHTAGTITGIVGIILSIIVGALVLFSAILPLILVGSYGGYNY